VYIMSRLLEEGIHIRGVEIGERPYKDDRIMGDYVNDYYFNRKHSEEYVLVAEAYANAIQTLNPEIQIGVPIGDSKVLRESIFNGVVVERATFADALVFDHSPITIDCATDKVACFQKKQNENLEQLGTTLTIVQDYYPQFEVWIGAFTGEPLNDFGDKAINRLGREYTRKMVLMMDAFGVAVAHYAVPLVGQASKPIILLIPRMLVALNQHNQPIEILFDSDYVYV